MRYVEIILSSVVVVAILQYLRGNKEDHLRYITKERTRWRKTIKKIIKEVSESDLYSINVILTKLKCNLNGYGYYFSGKYPKAECLNYMKDEHIWKEIDYLEKAVDCGDNGSLERHKNKLIMSLVLLLKFDWERSKKEVRSLVELAVAIFLFAVGMGMLIVGRYNFDGIHDNIKQCIFLSGSMVWLYGFAWVPYLLEIPKIFRAKKWYREIKSVVCSGIFLMLFCVLMGSVKNNYNEFLVEISKIICILSFAMAIFCPISSNSVYRDYEDNLYKILLNNQLDIYTASMWRGIFIQFYFIKYNLFIKIAKISHEVNFEKVFEGYEQRQLESICYSYRYLRIKSWIKYLLIRMFARIYGAQHIKTVKEFIEEKPSRCRTVVEYTNENNEKRYSIGINKKIWNEWFD